MGFSVLLWIGFTRSHLLANRSTVVSLHSTTSLVLINQQGEFLFAEPCNTGFRPGCNARMKGWRNSPESYLKTLTQEDLICFTFYGILHSEDYAKRFAPTTEQRTATQSKG